MGSDAAKTGTREEVSRYAFTSLRGSVLIHQGFSVDARNVSSDHERFEYALMSIWIMTYRELGSPRPYYFSLDEQSGKVVDELPVDNGKLFRYFLAILIPLFIALLALMYFIS